MRDLPNGYGAYYTYHTIYASKNMNWHPQEGYTVSINDNYYTYLNNDIIPTYIQYNNNIKFDVNYGCDLNNIDIASVKIKYGSYNPNYRYQYRINDLGWIDVTNDIYNASQEGYYETIASIYCNCNIEARVIDQNNNIIKSNNQAISSLNHIFGIDFTVNEACDLNNRDINVLSADFTYCWNDNFLYQYSYDNENWYDIALTNTNKQFILNHSVYMPINFRILDNNTIIYTNSFTDFTKILRHIKMNLDYNETDKNIIINIDFSQYTQFRDSYNMRVLINNQEIAEDTKQYIINNTNYTNFQEIKMDVYIDNYLVDSQCYSPNYGGYSFEEKYNQVQMDKLEEELENNDNNSLSSLVNLANKFLNAINSIITTIISLIMRFFDGLNVWIRSAIISEFIIMIICKIVKVVRK